MYRNKLKYPQFLIILMCFVTMAVIAGCGNSTDALGEFILQDHWQRHALPDFGITVLQNDEEGLLIGTESGLFKLNDDKGTFNSLGLENHEIVGVVRLKDHSLLASIKTLYNSGEATIFRSTNDGESWQPYLKNFGGEDGTYTRINTGPAVASSPDDTIYMGGGGGCTILQWWRTLGKNIESLG